MASTLAARWARWRTAAVVVAALALLYVGADRLLPDHLPPGVLVKGVVHGGLDALTAIGLILVYRSARIINFSQAAIGGV